MPPDIHALEIEFAKDPTLDTCIPLCEAYLSGKRFMEAMVVCKKGIKNGPGEARGRVMLARVYIEQGKLPKAQQELGRVMQDFPGNPTALALSGRLMLEQGQRDEAVVQLQQALQGDPTETTALRLLAQLGIPVAAATPPQQAMPPGAMPQAGAVPPAMPPQQHPMPAFAAGQAPTFGTPAPGAEQLSAQQGSLTAAPSAPATAAGVPDLAAAAGFSQSPPDSGDLDPSLDPNRSLEHVSDFFAPDTLGFATDGSDIETAGPGRLTILGFVPKNTGSIKTTIIVASAVIIVAGAIVAWQVMSSKTTREIAKYLKDVQVLMTDDRYVSYKKALALGDQVLALDDSHGETLAVMAYAAAILGHEHGEDGYIEKAEVYLDRSLAALEQETEFLVSARAYLAYVGGRLDKGIAQVKAIQNRGGSSPLFEMEAFRLMYAQAPQAKDTRSQMARLKESVVSQTRIYNFLGWHHARLSEWALAEKNFDSGLQNTKSHPASLLGKALAGLERGLGLKERHKDIAKDVKKAFVLKDEAELSLRDLALAHFVRAQLRLWQKKTSQAEADYAKAFELDPNNSMFIYLRGVALLKAGSGQRAVDLLRKVVAEDPNNVLYYKALAEAQMKAGASGDAEGTLRRAAELDGTNVDVKLLMGELKLGQKRYSAAIAAFEKLQSTDGGDAFARARIGISRAKRASGDKKGAVSFMESVLESAPADVTQPVQAEMWCELGQAFMDARKKPKAIQTFQVGIEQYRYYPDCHYFMCRALGRGREAKSACKSYLTLAPRGEYAADARRRLR